MSTVDERTDLDLIEQSWGEEHCEGDHSYKWIDPCAHRVVARSLSVCGEDLRVCGSYAAYVLDGMKKEYPCWGAHDAGCHLTTDECWSLEWL